MVPKSSLLLLTKSLAMAVLASVILSSSAQNSRRLQPVAPKLAPGEKISGREHPENFSRRVAFQSMLELLSIHPEDARHLQRRARLLEIKRIGLNANDAAVLEQIIESYRVKERERRTKAESIYHVSGKTSDFGELNRQHHADMRLASEAINRGISREGRMALNRFLDDVIAHSELHAPQVKTGVK